MRNTPLTLALTFLFFFFAQIVKAQKEANVWHFGNGVCIDFNSGSPVLVPGSAMSTYEGSASVCDKNGNLLFYTNGGDWNYISETGHIWNKLNASMWDMLGVMGGGASAAQSSVIIKAPCEDSVYFLFTMEDYEEMSGTQGLSYWTIDMRLGGGLGAVVLANQPIYAPSIEGLCAIRHANGDDYWIIIHQDTLGLGIYSVTGGSIPSITFLGNYSALGSFMGSGSAYPGFIKASPNGKSLASTSFNPTTYKMDLYVMDFNNSTGTISSPRQVNPTLPGAYFTSYEFSPNSRYLYTSQYDSLTPYPLSQSVSQYNLQTPVIGDSVQVLSSYMFFNFGISNLQLGPDGHIYFISADDSINLSRIVCTNTLGATVENNLFTFAPDTSFMGLPNFPSWIFENYNTNYVSLGLDTILLCPGSSPTILSPMSSGSSYLWSTGETTSSISVNTPGTYFLTVSGTCGVGHDTVNIILKNCEYEIGFTPDSCLQNAISFTAFGKDNILSAEWNFGDIASGASNFSSLLTPNHLFTEPNTYTVSVILNYKCLPSDTLTRSIQIIDCDSTPTECVLTMPNVFSPNDDGINETYYPITDCSFETYSFAVFNRWGNRLFLTAYPDQQWDGNFNGLPCPAGVYYFIVEYDTPYSDPQTEKGHFNLAR